MDKQTIKKDKKIALTIALKYNQLKRDKLENLEVVQFVNYLFNHKWKDYTPDSIAVAIIEIMDADAGKIVTYLSNDALVDSKHNELSDYSDLFAKELI